VTARRRVTTRATTRVDAVAYLAKAKEFLRAAQDSFELGNYVAAASNAVHAGIASCDAISSFRIGSVWVGEHGAAAAHVQAAGAEGRQAAGQIRRLMPLKHRAEYDPRPLSVTEARAAVRSAERLVVMADRVALSALGE
jgi:hypothetical protein